MAAKNFRIGIFTKAQRGRSLSPDDFGRLESLIEELYDRSKTLTLCTALGAAFELRIIRWALASRQCRLSDLKLEILTDSSRIRKFRNGTPFSLADIFREADELVALDADFPSLRQHIIADYLIEHSDMLLYRDIPQRSEPLLAQQTASGLLEAVSLGEISDNLMPSDYYGTNLLAESVRFVRMRNFSLSSTDIPRSLLDAWSSKNPERFRRYCLAFQYEWADILHLRDPHGVFLPFKIFTYAYCWAHDFWMIRIENHTEDVYRRFLQFQNLVNYIRRKRLLGHSVHEFDLFGFEQYERIIEKFTKHEKDKAPRKRKSPGDY